MPIYTKGKKKETSEKKEKKVGLFDFLSAVSYTKENLLRNTDDPSLVKVYNPFMINRGLSYHVSSIMDANIMNQCAILDPDMQFEYLLNTVRKERRFSKWFKPEANENIELISKHYNVNQQRAQEYLAILSTDQIEKIKDMYYIGGVEK